MNELRFEESYGDYDVWATPDGTVAHVKYLGDIVQWWHGESAYMDAHRYADDCNVKGLTIETVWL